jgi:trimeric autotransporter adhesin
MENTFSSHSTALGYQTLANSIGNGNTAMGSQALFANTIGISNVGVGWASMGLATGASYTTAVGVQTLSSLTTGEYNTAIGYNANVSTGTLTNATAIGNGAIVNASNKVRLGNSGVTVIEGQVPFTTPSDGRYKYNVKEDVKGLDFIMQLRPVTYQFDVQRFDAVMENNNTAHPVSNVLQASYNEAAAIRRTGFIAQEVEQAAVKTGYNFSGINKPKTAADHYSLSYESFVVPLVKAVQEQNKQIDELKKTIGLQQQALEELTKRLEKLEKQ